MTAPALHLHKTLCAMRWIALLNGNTELAGAIALDQAHLKKVLSK